MSLTLEHLSMAYPVQGRKQKEVALTDINLTIEEGEFVGILGRSGAGKSTFIRCINQLVRPTGGHVYWADSDMTKLNGKKLRVARREMGMIFQLFHLVPRLSALHNCVLGCFSYRSPWKNMLGVISKEEREQALNALERVGIGHLAHKRVDKLSGGEQQRVAIARVIMQKPKLLLGDEPVASVDPVTTKQVMQLIRDLHEADNMTTIINLHNVQIAIDFCDRIIGLSKGRVVFDGTPDEVNDDVLSTIYV